MSTSVRAAPKLRGSYAKTPAQRERIVDAAFAEFIEVGFAEATINGIARRAEMSRAGILHHFATKTDVLAATLARCDAVIDAHMEGRRGVDVVRGILSLFAGDQALADVMRVQGALSAEALRPDHPAHAHFARRFAAIAEALDEAFAVMAVEGRATTDVPTAQIARESLALAEGLFLQWLRGDTDVDVAAAVRRHVQRFFSVDA
ncbi:helix-turn-helix domain-containing protein [Microbacterium sp. BWR-S6Y]|uniref:TetR/AcrR family transcriptional regulator n=1 Tax=Microbacterium sp. BWR-S6Y TaxID=3232073 RepID=UPI00352839FD